MVKVKGVAFGDGYVGVGVVRGLVASHGPTCTFFVKNRVSPPINPYNTLLYNTPLRGLDYI